MYFTEWNSTGIIISMILYIIMVLLLRTYYINPNNKNKSKDRIVYLLFFVFCIFPLYALDTFGYNSYYVAIQEGVHLGTAIEDIYYDIILWCNSIITFRLVIWGGASIIVLYIAKLLEIRIGPFFLFLITLFILKFSYARVYISYALMFLGLAIYYKKHSMLLYKLIGIALIIYSVQFHKSALFGAVITMITIFIPTLKKIHIKWLLIAYPFVVILTTFLLSDFLNLEIMDGDMMSQSAQRYLNKQESEVGIGKIFENILTRIPFYSAIYIYIYMVFKGTITKLPIRIQKFSTAGFLLVVFASVFIFDHGVNTHTFYYRLLHFSIIPLSVYMGYLYYNKINLGVLKPTLKIGFIGSIYTLLYTLYNSLV